MILPTPADQDTDSDSDSEVNQLLRWQESNWKCQLQVKVSVAFLPSQQLVDLHFVSLVFYLAKERFSLSKRGSLLVLHIIVFLPSLDVDFYY